MTKPINDKNSSLLMSPELYGVLDLTDNDEAKELVKTQTKIVAFHILVNTKSETMLSLLKAIGDNKNTNTTSLEVSLPEDNAIDFYLGIRNNILQIKTIEIHQQNDVIDIFKNKPIFVHKCNIYDVSIQSNDATMVLELSYINGEKK